MPTTQPNPRFVLRYVDRPEISETFADSAEKMFFDGNTLRLEFTVTRFDDPKPPAAPTGRKCTACRLVLSQEGALDLINKMFTLRDQLIKRGILTAAGNPTTPPQQPLN
jgi:hypothetical protein